MDPNRVIGKDNDLPWRLPEDLKYFKEMTLGKPVIMGRKTFESMGSKPLPKRPNIILTSAQDFHPAGCRVAHSVKDALAAAKSQGDVEEIMVIGGAKVYEAFLPLATHLYLTLVHQEYAGDTYFPEFDRSEWTVISENKTELFTTKILERKSFSKG